MADVKTFVPALDRAPPSNVVGAFAWVRDNLFGSIGNSVDLAILFFSSATFRRSSNGH